MNNDTAPVNSLAKLLTKSASRYAFRSLESYMNGEWNDFSLFAGIAIEHIAKARLANSNVAFLAPDRKFKAAVALNRASEDADLLPPGTQTVGASPALERCASLHPELKEVLDEAKSLVAMRNGEVHMGYPGVEPSRQEFVRFVRAIEKLSLETKVQLWEPHESYVREAVDERTQEIYKKVENRLAAARTRFDQLMESNETAYLEQEFESAKLRRDMRIDNDRVMALECPVCEQAAVALGYTDQTDIEAEIDEDGLGSVWPVLTFFLDELSCETCGLKLVSEEEIHAANVDVSWDNQDIDVDKWMEAHWAGDYY